MKKCWFLLVITLFLWGCSAQETFETVSDVQDISAMAQMQQISITLPKDAAAASMENPNAGKLYLCDGYTLTVQTLDAGDLDKTLQQLTGYKREQLTVMETKQANAKRYESAWSAAGEGGDQVGRVVILDDGNYHYAVTVMADASGAGELTEVWQEILGSVALVSTD